MRLKHIIILQNKVDLIKDDAAEKQHQQILEFVKGTHLPCTALLDTARTLTRWLLRARYIPLLIGTVAENAPVIPISAQLKYNIDAVVEYIIKKIPVPVRDFTARPRLIVIRSFDVNKPGAEVDVLRGGVAGGSILRGVLKVRCQHRRLWPFSC